MGENPGCELDLGVVNQVRVNSWSVKDAVKNISNEQSRLNGVHRVAWLLRAVSCIDLTTLAADDTNGNVTRLCQKARYPITPKLLEALRFAPAAPFAVAAVCVYPARVADAVSAINRMAAEKIIPVASVATGFPTGQFNLESRLMEIRHAVAQGAREIDIVIDRRLVLLGLWDTLYQELQLMKESCGSASMKTILAVGELGTLSNVYKASLVAMMAGSDFIKTSTGKETVNATLEVGLVMMRAIREYHTRTGYKVGFKAAGGIKTSLDALDWLILTKQELGSDWLNKNLFRIGASSLLADIEKTIYMLVFGQPAAEHLFNLG